MGRAIEVAMVHSSSSAWEKSARTLLSAYKVLIPMKDFGSGIMITMEWLLRHLHGVKLCNNLRAYLT